MSDVRMYAVTPGGPAPVEPPGGTNGVHEALEGLPPGVYSGLRTFHHERFLRLDLHLARTHASLAASGWEDFDEGPLRRALHETARAFPRSEARVRFDVLSESVDLGRGATRVFVALASLPRVPAELLRLGVQVGLARDLKRESPRVKTTDFVRRRRGYPVGTRQSYEHLLLDGEGRILEGTSSNVIGVEGGSLRTAGAGVLEGVTRRIVLELAEELEVPVKLEPIALTELARLDELFLTSSSRGLVPIVSVAGARVGSGRPGPVFRLFREAYDSYAEREAKPAIETG